MTRRFALPPRRQTATQPAQGAPTATTETPADFDAVADALTAAAESLRTAADDWRAALTADDGRAVLVAKISGQAAALTAAGALSRLSTPPHMGKTRGGRL